VNERLDLLPAAEQQAYRLLLRMIGAGWPTWRPR
jgi:hypothetical protein